LVGHRSPHKVGAKKKNAISCHNGLNKESLKRKYGLKMGGEEWTKFHKGEEGKFDLTQDGSEQKKFVIRGTRNPQGYNKNKKKKWIA